MTCEQFGASTVEQLKAFRALKKAGGKILKAAVEDFNANSLKHGRGHMRPAYDWIKYTQRIRLSTDVMNANDMDWVTRYEFAWHMKLINNWDEPTAFAKFDEQAELLPAGC